MMVEVDSIELEKLRRIALEHESAQQGGNVIRGIIGLVATFYGVAVHEIKGRCQTPLVVRARYVAIYIARRKTTLTLGEIGRAFGQRDHSNVLYAVRRVEVWIDGDQKIKQQIGMLEREILGRAA